MSPGAQCAVLRRLGVINRITLNELESVQLLGYLDAGGETASHTIRVTFDTEGRPPASSYWTAEGPPSRNDCDYSSRKTLDASIFSVARAGIQQAVVAAAASSNPTPK